VSDPVRELNRAALDPARCVVIEACAGSGKTWLLVSRIVRLLLAGAKPSEILAITFTRKAAQEMAARLHDWLHDLATLPDEEVIDFLRIREVPESEIRDLLPKARTLLEGFLTDQPGITMGTFHGWFLQLLRKAPLAAGAGAASLVEQTSALIDEAWQLFAEHLRHNPESPLARALDYLFATCGLANTRSLLIGFLHKRAEWWSFVRGAPDPVQFALDRLRAQMPVAPQADVCAELFGDATFIAQLREYTALLARNGTPGDRKTATAVLASEPLPPARRFEILCSKLFKTDGELRARAPNAAVERRLGAAGQARLLELHAGLGARLAVARSHLTEQAMFRLNEAGLACGHELLAAYQRIKAERGLIDYTDVEWQAWELLNESQHAEYMQYKLDARYRHILLDEFQDTNPLQWQVLSAWLTASVEAGSRPTVFLVGDPKQSIYRFRRAEPRLFGIAAQYLQERFGARRLEQNVTRRNAPPIVEVVNALFGQEPLFEAFLAHETLRPRLPGAVQVKPLIAHDEEELAPVAWRNPLDAPRVDATDRRREREAQQLARTIGQIVGRWEVRDESGTPRPARYEDIMVLVARRTHLDIYERALRHAQIPYLSSRQGGLLDTLETGDLMALLQFLVLPSSDLHLAHALRSPLFSAADEDLALLASSPGSNWWRRLQKLAHEGAAPETLARAYALLSGWLREVDRRPVHDLLDRIYFEADVMRRYEAAVPAPMRTAVAANLRAFMEVALATDAGRYPSLQGFLHQLADLKRATPEEAPGEGIVVEGADAVRILTVHGAKGLEAPIVWLLDAAASDRRAEGYSALVDWPPEAALPGHFSLLTRKSETGASREPLVSRETQLAAREDLNLLYVAMTRAKQALIVSGIDGRGADSSWHAKVAAAVERVGALPVALPPAAAQPAPPTAVPVLDRALLEALSAPLNVGRRVDNLVDPRRRHGTLLHALLEHMAPPRAIEDRDFLRRKLGLDESEFERIWKEAHAILASPELRRFFDPKQYLRAVNELAYVSESGELKRIDRLVELEGEIWVLDYKTGEAIDPENLAAAAKPYRKQLEEYRAAVSKLIPGKPVSSALVFAGGYHYAMPASIC
jgi:ATP-dependent helicase/nuclease subunit A